MIGWTPRLSPQAEHAVRAIHRARVLVHRTRGMALPSSGAESYRAEANATGVVQAFAVLDSYLTGRADELLHRELPLPAGGTPLEEFVHLQVGRSFRGSIRGPLAFWKQALRVDIQQDAPLWREVHELRELRNLIVHSLRSLRPHGQELRPAIAKRLKSYGLDPDTFVGQIPTNDRDFDELALWVESGLRSGWIKNARRHWRRAMQDQARLPPLIRVARSRR